MANRPKVRITTNLGAIDFELYADKAPITVANFLQYVNDKFYDGSVFHRIIKGFMVQGGGMDADLNRLKRRDPIKNEWRNGLKNVTGSVAMARPGGDPDSATSQFFVNCSDNESLDEQQDDGGGYCVFAQVVNGMDVVRKIENQKTHLAKGEFKDCPVDMVHIVTIRVI